jgi:hypothetical protein
MGREVPAEVYYAVSRCHFWCHTERSQERRTILSGEWECDLVTLTMSLGMANLSQASLGTPADRQLGWGGTGLTRDQP